MKNTPQKKKKDCLGIKAVKLRPIYLPLATHLPAIGLNTQVDFCLTKLAQVTHLYLRRPPFFYLCQWKCIPFDILACT